MVVPPTSLTRSELRSVMREVRARFVAALAPGEHAALNAALAERLRPLADGHEKIAGYAAMRDEIDPAALPFGIWPRVGGNGQPLCFHHAAPQDLGASPGWDILEPLPDAPRAVPSLVLVPLIAADARGNRLGFGKGYYDRTLPLYDALRVGVAFDCQVIDHVPAEAWDAPLDWLVTPTRTIRCVRDAAALPPVGVAPASG